MVANLTLHAIYTVIDGAIYTISKQGGLYVATSPKGLLYGETIDEVKAEIGKVASFPIYKYIGKNIREL